MEAADGLEPSKTGFADRRLDHFGIAASEKSIPKFYTQNCAQTAFLSPIYPVQNLRKLLKPLRASDNEGLSQTFALPLGDRAPSRSTLAKS
jgi:hypothetical protein